MGFWTQIQNSDGSFDEFYPNERGWAAPTGFSLYAILDAYRLLRQRIPPKISERILDTATKAIQFLIRHDEPSTVANHHALVALALYKAYGILKQEYIFEGFQKKLDGFFKLHNPEGWSWEYDGADLGYLSATVSFLGKLYAMYKNNKLLGVLENTIRFTSYFVYPNGSYAGPVGSRQTVHFYPHGYEILSHQIPLAGAVAQKMLEALHNGKLVPPEVMADRYFLYRIPEFLQSYLDYKPRLYPLLRLPYEAKPFAKYFKDARIFIAKLPKYYLVIGLNKGGIIRIFSLDPPKMTFSDSGIIGRLTDGKLVSSQWVDRTYVINFEEKMIEASGRFHKIPTPLFTPLKMMLFRAVMITLGRSTKLAYFIKNQIINMMMTSNKTVPVIFTRRIKYSQNVIIQDTIKLLKKVSFRSLGIGDEFSTKYVPQSRYFQQYELSTRGLSLKRLLNELNEKRNLKLTRVITPESGDMQILIDLHTKEKKAPLNV